MGVLLILNQTHGLQVNSPLPLFSQALVVPHMLSSICAGPHEHIVHLASFVYGFGLKWLGLGHGYGGTHQAHLTGIDRVCWLRI